MNVPFAENNSPYLTESLLGNWIHFEIPASGDPTDWTNKIPYTYTGCKKFSAVKRQFKHHLQTTQSNCIIKILINNETARTLFKLDMAK